MKKLIISLVLIFSMFQITQVCIAQTVSDDELINAAKSFFDTYKLYTENFDPDIINLYADNATIIMVGVYEDDPTRKIQINGSLMKKVLIQILPNAKEKEDIDRFYDEKYTVLENSQVKINCTRYSELKKYEKPHEIIVEVDENGKCKIIYEKAILNSDR